MKPTPLAPALPDRGAGPRWGLAASTALHLLLVLALFGVAIRHLPPDGSPAPAFDLVFEGPGAATPAPDAPPKPPPSQPADLTPPPDAMPGPPAPTPLSTPDPDAATLPPPAATTAPPPQPDSAPPTAAPPSPETPSPQEPPTEEPAIRLQLPPRDAAQAVPQPIMPEPIMPKPPPPLPPIEPQLRPMRQASRPAPRAAAGTLSNPMNLSLGPAAPRPAARGSVASRSLDLSPPPERDGPNPSDPYAQIRAANASADWNRGLLQYWLRHRYYPQQAAANGEQGAVTIQLTVNRSGRVESVEVLSRSGSRWLDMAAVATWRDARLPPFTNEMREDRITFPVPIQYSLIGR